MRRAPRRWNTPLGRWVCDFGVRRLTDEMRAAGEPVTPGAVYKWVAGDHAPRARHATIITRVSRGRLSMDDIYRRRT